MCLNIKNTLILHFMTPLKATGQTQNDPCTTFHKTKHHALLFACKRNKMAGLISVPDFLYVADVRI